MAEFTRDGMNQLLQMAQSYVNTPQEDFYLITWFYRNKPRHYFDKILAADGVMRMYMKDKGGDPRSHINGKLEGLFFATHVDWLTGQPPNRSPFGDTRLSIPASEILDDDVRIYFADFYCKQLGRPHYVTLVVTRPYSIADRFCDRKLIRLDKYNNDFLRKDMHGVSVRRKVLVEVLYTEDIDVQKVLLSGTSTYTPTASTGESRPGGLPKCRLCSTCNV